MALVRSSPPIEEWLGRSADSWSLLSDREYRSLVERWHHVFSASLEGGLSAAVQGPTAVAKFEALLPTSVILFNGLSVPQAFVTGSRHPHAYHVVRLRAVAAEVAHALDLVLVDETFTYSCICTHEWHALAHPIFLHAAA